MQSPHGQLSGFHYFICILEASMLLAFLNLSCKMFQILGPRNEILSDPWYTVLIGVMVNWELFLRSQCRSFLCSKSSLTIILYTSVARIWRFRFWTETVASFSSCVSNDDYLSEYIIRNQRSCSLFILPLLARLCHIHTRWKQLNCDLKNAFIRMSLFEMYTMLLLIMHEFFYQPFCEVLKCDHRKRAYGQM